MNHETQALDKEIADKNILSNIYGISYAIHFSFRETPAAAAAAKSLQSCPTRCDPEGLPWDSPGKNTGVGCLFPLQCVKVKSKSEVTQSCPTLSDPMDCSPPGSSIHGIFQARVLEWGAIAFSELRCRCGYFISHLMSSGHQ